MIAQFPDHKSLTFAYEDLLRIGVPEQRISAYFEEVGEGQQDRTEHESFIQQLHAWVADAHASATEESVPTTPSSSRFKEHGGTLDIKCPQLEAAIVETIIRHEGQLVG